ncbi:MAG TPA: TRAP transporter small permease [Chloroflexota bacterium]|nr:TRAP transporter small permease [Chloroflexota bacterium]
METNGVTAKRRSPVVTLLINIPEIVAGTLLVVMAITVVLQVVFRYIFQAPLSWSEELCRDAFIWLSTISAALGVKYGLHFSIEALVKRLPGKLGRGVQILTSLAVSWLLLIMIWYGMQLVMRNMTQISSILGIPMSIPYLSVPVGCALMLVYLWVGILRNDQQRDETPIMVD